MRKAIQKLITVFMTILLVSGCVLLAGVLPGGIVPVMAAGSSAKSTAESGGKEETYRSELSGLEISSSLKNQRPIAVMIDDDSRALPHYGLSDADVVYELMNSTANGRITRLMAIFKDWNGVEKIGSIRSTRPTNILIAEEYGAVLCHDGGPYYNNQYFEDKAIDHLSGGFTRINNGKAREFTEFILAGEAAKRMKAAGISTEYSKYVNGDAKKSHFRFSKSVSTLSNRSDSFKALEVDLPLDNTKSKLVYNKKTNTYDFYQHGTLIKDGTNNKTVSFDNVILMDVGFTKLDQHGYLIYNCLSANQPGYLLKGGYAIPILWTKNSGTDPTKYFTQTGALITLSPGKTYITMVPDDSWDAMTIKKK